MNYKFLKITSFYPEFLKNYYRRNNTIVHSSYSKQYAHLMATKFGWSDFFQKGIIALGNEAYEIVLNAEPLQKVWAIENNISPEDNSLLLKQIELIRPNIIFLYNSMDYTPEFIDIIRERNPSVKQIIGWCCSPIKPSHFALYKKCDYVITCSQKFMDLFKNEGIDCYELNHAFDLSILEQIDNIPFTDREDLIFSGYLIHGIQFHHNRIKLLEAISRKNYNIKYYVNPPESNLFYTAALQMSYLGAKSLSMLGLKRIVNLIPKLNKALLSDEFPKSTKPSKYFLDRIAGKPLFGIDMFNMISTFKIGLNYHGSIAGDYAANMRMFELTGVGTCLLTDNKSNINKFFTPDKEIVTYNNIDECIEKITWLTDNPAATKQIAEAGQKRTLKDHNYKIRAEQLNEIILKNLK